MLPRGSGSDYTDRVPRDLHQRLRRRVRVGAVPAGPAPGPVRRAARRRRVRRRGADHPDERDAVRDRPEPSRPALAAHGGVLRHRRPEGRPTRPGRRTATTSTGTGAGTTPGITASVGPVLPDDGKDAIDEQLAAIVPVIASTRFGRGAGWSKGHCVLLLSQHASRSGHRPERVLRRRRPRGIRDRRPGSGPFGSYGRASAVTTSLPRAAGRPGPALPGRHGQVRPRPRPGPGGRPGRADGHRAVRRPRPAAVPAVAAGLVRPAGRLAARRGAGQDIPDSDAAVSPVMASDPSAVPDAPPDEGSWPYVVSVTSPDDGLSVFVAGNMQAGLLARGTPFRHQRGDPQRDRRDGRARPTQQVTLAAPASYGLTLSAGPGAASRVPGSRALPRRHAGDRDGDAGPGLRLLRLDRRRRRGGRRPAADAADGRRPHGRPRASPRRRCSRSRSARPARPSLAGPAQQFQAPAPTPTAAPPT